MDLRYQTVDAENDYAAFDQWWQAVLLGFHHGSPSERTIGEVRKRALGDRWVMTGCYDDAQPADAWDHGVPVGTFAAFDGTINLGDDILLTSHLISQVTVRATHRRRGILRQLMTSDLQQAKASGHALAALTATEGTIYGRFGFGMAAWRQAITVDGAARVQTPPLGRMQYVDRATLNRLGPEIFAGHHRRTIGSVNRGIAYVDEKAGGFDEFTEGERPKIRSALHLSPDGTPDGYVSYQPRGSFEDTIIQVIDLVAATDDAYLGLWDFLLHLDLVKRLIWDNAPVSDPLRWALDDPRKVRVDKVSDALWIRILDPIEAFQRRAYASPDLDLTLRIIDPMGLADGTFEISVRDRAAVVTPTSAPAHAEVGAAELGSLFLGGVSPAVLRAAGRINCPAEGTVRLDQLLSGFAPAYCNTRF